MSAPVATSAINTNRTKVVGTGLTLKSTIDRDVLGLTPEAAKEWQTKAEAEFRLWAENRRNCDAMGMNNFYGLQQLALKSWLMSGDVFAVVKIRDVDKLHPTPCGCIWWRPTGCLHRTDTAARLTFWDTP